MDAGPHVHIYVFTKNMPFQINDFETIGRMNLDIELKPSQVYMKRMKNRNFKNQISKLQLSLSIFMVLHIYF